MSDEEKNQEEQEEVLFDHDADLDDSVVAEESQKDTIQKLREKLKKTEAEKQEYLTGWQRTKADFVNLRKKDEEEREAFLKFSIEKLVLDIVPVLESFEQALKNNTDVGSSWRIGMESIYNQLLSILAKYGVSPIKPEGAPFDPKLHEAVTVTKTGEKSEDGAVSQVLQTGYELNGKVIRPAKVAVNEYHE